MRESWHQAILEEAGQIGWRRCVGSWGLRLKSGDTYLFQPEDAAKKTGDGVLEVPGGHPEGCAAPDVAADGTAAGRHGERGTDHPVARSALGVFEGISEGHEDRTDS